jgi:hypothetical protein
MEPYFHALNTSLWCISYLSISLWLYESAWASVRSNRIICVYEVISFSLHSRILTKFRIQCLHSNVFVALAPVPVRLEVPSQHWNYREIKQECLVGFWVLTVVIENSTIIWDVRLCGLVKFYVSEDLTASIFSIESKPRKQQATKESFYTCVTPSKCTYYLSFTQIFQRRVNSSLYDFGCVISRTSQTT